MIKEVKNAKFDYKGIIDLSDDYKEKIKCYWEQLQEESSLLKEGKILVVSNFIDDSDSYNFELKETTFSHYMYEKKYENMDLKCMFSGAYIVTSDNYVCAVLNNAYKGKNYEELNLPGGMADFKDIVNNEYSPLINLKREFKEELGFDLNDSNYEINLKYVKCPSDLEDSFGYPIGMIYEVKTVYTKEQLLNMFDNNIRDIEIKDLVFFNKDNYKDIYDYEYKKGYMLELWEKLFN